MLRLQQLGHEVHESLEHEVTGRLATVRLLHRGASGSAALLDLLFATSGIEPEVVEAADVLDVVPGSRAPVARTGHLIALKLLSRTERRAIDQQDLVDLIEIADELEIERAREAVRLITTRGYARDRDLEADLDEFLSRR